MSQETVYDYVMKTNGDDEDFKMLHQYALDKIRSCNFGPKYGYYLYEYFNLNLSGDGVEFTFNEDLFVNHIKYIPLSVYEYMYDNKDYSKIIHKYLQDKNFTDKDCMYYVRKLDEHNARPYLRTNVKLVYYDKSIEIDRVHSCDYEWSYIPYKYCIKYEFNGRICHCELIDFFPQYVEPKHTKQDYINYFIANDSNCNRLRKMIIELTKLMLSRREEDITHNVKQDDIIDDLQLLINYAQQLIIDCKAYLDKHMNDTTVKLSL